MKMRDPSGDAATPIGFHVAPESGTRAINVRAAASIA